MALLKNICSLKSMRQMEECFNEECCIDTLRYLSGDKKLKEMPHYDTLNYYLEMLPPEELVGVKWNRENAKLSTKKWKRGEF